MRTPPGATALLSLSSQLDGRNILTWAVGSEKVQTVEIAPYPRKVGMQTPEESLLYKLWELLDSKLSIILASPSWESLDRERAGNEARGICETLAILMQPFITDADDVVRHAVKRYRAKLASQDYTVPGLAAHIWDPTSNYDGTPIHTSGTNKTLSVVTLTEDKIAAVRAAMASGMFTPNQLADMFKVDKATIERYI